MGLKLPATTYGCVGRANSWVRARADCPCFALRTWNKIWIYWMRLGALPRNYCAIIPIGQSAILSVGWGEKANICKYESWIPLLQNPEGRPGIALFHCRPLSEADRLYR